MVHTSNRRLADETQHAEYAASNRLDDDVYERVKAHKREDERMSEAIDRLIGTPSLHELGGILDDDQVDETRKTIEDADEEDAEEVEEGTERFN